MTAPKPDLYTLTPSRTAITALPGLRFNQFSTLGTLLGVVGYFWPHLARPSECETAKPTRHAMAMAMATPPVTMVATPVAMAAPVASAPVLVEGAAIDALKIIPIGISLNFHTRESDNTRPP